MDLEQLLTPCTAVSASVCSAGQKYAWSNVAIGGGGYVTGVIHSRAEEGLIYARTDIGGAYRWSGEHWIPLTDHIGQENWNYNGVESMAADPVEPGRVYAMCGTYMHAPGVLLISENYGETWETVALPFPCGANCSGRGTGERLAADPRQNSRLYMGTRNAGLWRSEDFGRSWARVESFPVRGDHIQENAPVGVMWVKFCPVTGDVYAGAAETSGVCVYRSSDGGNSWLPLPSLPPGMYPLQADLDANGVLYLACSSNCGPNLSPESGGVFRWDGRELTDITPPPDDGRYGGFGGISADCQHPGTILVSTLGFWTDVGDNFYRSDDGGRTWTGIFDGEEKRYDMDVSQADWLRWGEAQAKTGWWITTVSLDPFCSDTAMYVTGAGIFRMDNLTALGRENTVISFASRGLEETCVFRMVSPEYKEDQPQLYSILGDLTGFAHLDVTKNPDDVHFLGGRICVKPTGLDAAFRNAGMAVFAVEEENYPLWYTRNGGSSWEILKAPEKAEGGTVAVSADGSSVIWIPAEKGTVYQFDFAAGCWYYVSGLGLHTKIAADRVCPGRFYAVYNGGFHVSHDGGASFTMTGAVPADCEIVTVPGREGHVWLYSRSLVMYTEDGGRNFTKLTSVHMRAVGFGAPEKEGEYPVIFGIGSVGDAGEGIFRCTDRGRTWQRINDAQHCFGNLNDCITGDARIPGRVYIASNGRGIIMGDAVRS